MRVSELIRKCVVFIGMVNPDGEFVAYGTGFLITVFLEEVAFNYVVTCKHVIDSIVGEKVCVRVNTMVNSVEIVNTNKPDWVIKSKYDIAVLSKPFASSKYDVTSIADKLFATKGVIKEQEIEPGELVFLVGLFVSHYGTNRNMPIVRIGNIAAIPEDPILTSIGYMKNGYLVEMRSIGGFSGSPVFVRILPCRLINNILSLGGQIKSLLLGMMQGLYIVEPEAYPGESKADAMNAGIGIVIPIEAIMETINEPLLIDQREKTLKQLKKKSGVRPATAINTSNNPQHKEDFKSLVSVAAK